MMENLSKVGQTENTHRQKKKKKSAKSVHHCQNVHIDFKIPVRKKKKQQQKPNHPPPVY